MEVQSLARVLSQSTVFRDMSPDELEFLSGCAKNVRFNAGAKLFREGDEAAELLLLRAGRVALQVNVPGRGDVPLETLAADDLIGWSALFPPHTWHLDAMAIEATRAISIDGKCVRRKIETEPMFGRSFMRCVLRQVHQRLERTRLRQLDVYRKPEQ